jgi:hypothetical protein
MIALLRISKWRPLAGIFERLPVWILMTLLVFAVGLLVPDQDTVYHVEVALGILTALYFSQLTSLLKRREPGGTGLLPESSAGKVGHRPNMQTAP